MPMATIDDAEWFYTDHEGGEPTVLLVHGWTCDSRPPCVSPKLLQGLTSP